MVNCSFNNVSTIVVCMNHMVYFIKFRWIKKRHNKYILTFILTLLSFYVFIHYLVAFEPSRCIKASFYISEEWLKFPHPGVLERKFSWDCCDNNDIFSFICDPLQIIFIHYKSRIATTIRGLWWLKMTIASSGLKGLTNRLLEIS